MDLDNPKELRKAARRESRWWYYDRASRRDSNDPTWRSRWWPWFGNEEYGRKTVVLPIPFHGEVVFAFWTWTDAEADEIRRSTYTEKALDLLRPRAYERTYMWTPELLYLDVKHDLDDIDISWSLYLEGDNTQTIRCAFLSLGYNAFRIYPQYLDSVTAVTVRVERKETP